MAARAENAAHMGVYKQSKILRHQLERFVSGLKLRLQTARRGKVSGPDIWGWHPDFWCTKMDVRVANQRGISIALSENIQLLSPEHLQIDQYWLSQRNDLSAQTGAG